MPYVTSIERLARAEGIEEGLNKGRQEGRQEGFREGLLEGITLDLDAKFGSPGRKLLPKIRAVGDLTDLRQLAKLIKSAETLNEVRRFFEKIG